MCVEHLKMNEKYIISAFIVGIMRASRIVLQTLIEQCVVGSLFCSFVSSFIRSLR